MSCSCSCEAPHHGDHRFKKALWMALVLNFSMFVIEVAGGIVAHSSALWADSLDFFGDSANYVISLFALGMGMVWRSRTALLKGWCMAVFGVAVLVKAVWSYRLGIVPESWTMGGLGVLALVVNVAAAWVLYAFRGGDANMQSVWLCSRNDALGNIALIVASLGIWQSQSIVPDLVVAAVMALLGLSAGIKIIKTSRRELSEAA